MITDFITKKKTKTKIKWFKLKFSILPDSEERKRKSGFASVQWISKTKPGNVGKKYLIIQTPRSDNTTCQPNF